MNRSYLTLLVFGICCLMATGCNVFDGLYEEGSSSDPDVLAADADIALQRSEPDKAVRYLEKALAKTPDSPIIRTKLSSALMQANDIDVLKMLELNDELSGAALGSSKHGSYAASKLGSVSGQICNFNGTPTETIDLSATPAYHEILAVDSVVSRVQELLAPVIDDPEQMDSLPDELRDTALLNAAIARVLNVLLNVEQRRLDERIVLYRLENDDVGICADDEVSLVGIQQFVKCDEIPELSSALDLLRARLSVSDDNSAVDAVDELQDAIDKLKAEIDIDCSL